MKSNILESDTCETPQKIISHSKGPGCRYFHNQQEERRNRIRMANEKII